MFREDWVWFTKWLLLIVVPVAKASATSPNRFLTIELAVQCHPVHIRTITVHQLLAGPSVKQLLAVSLKTRCKLALFTLPSLSLQRPCIRPPCCWQVTTS